jgi:hypothetical protein
MINRGGAVTPPLPEGSGFSLSRLRSLTKGKPCPQDVDRRVHVGVGGVPARRTGELGLGALSNEAKPDGVSSQLVYHDVNIHPHRQANQ